MYTLHFHYVLSLLLLSVGLPRRSDVSRGRGGLSRRSLRALRFSRGCLSEVHQSPNYPTNKAQRGEVRLRRIDLMGFDDPTFGKINEMHGGSLVASRGDRCAFR